MQELGTNPTTQNLTIYATNSTLLGRGAFVTGGDIGVRNVGSGPFLSPGFELAVGFQVRVQPPPGAIFNALSAVSAAQIRELFDDFGDMKRTSTISHPGGEVLADVEYKRTRNLFE